MGSHEPRGDLGGFQGSGAPGAAGIDPRLQKGQAKILEKVKPLLDRLLRPGETVLLALRACSPMTTGQQLTTGWVIYVLKRCVLVVTNQRILHIPTTRSYAARGSVAQIDFGDITETKFGKFPGRTLTLNYRSGKKEQFLQLPGREQKALQTLLPPLAGNGAPSEAGRRRHICPQCQKTLVEHANRCTCGIEFKDRQRATRLSFLLPGGGYFYTRHYFMGVLDALVETYLTVLVLLLIFAALTESGDESAGAGIGAVILALFLLIEKLITVSHARHFVDEFIPIEPGPAPGTRSMAPPPRVIG